MPSEILERLHDAMCIGVLQPSLWETHFGRLRWMEQSDGCGTATASQQLQLSCGAGPQRALLKSSWRQAGKAGDRKTSQ